MDGLLGVDGAELPLDNLAEKMLFFSPEAAKPEPGRPLAIDDGRLFNARDHLVWLLEQTWPDIGDRLQWIRKPLDVLDTLHVWNDANNCWNQHYVSKALLRPSTVPANAKWLATIRRRLGELNIAARNASEELDRCRQSVEKAERAFSDQLSPADKAVVQDQIARRRENFSNAEAKYEAARKRQDETQNLLLDGEATFARDEFVRFCRSNRYRLTPLNIANALAGLPHIGWRQSTNRCRTKAAVGVDGKSIQVFRTIERIVRSSVRRVDLIRHAEKWLRSQKGKKKSLGVSELQEKWYYLRWSIKAVIEAVPRVQTRDLPYAIAREYRKRISRPSNVDLLFEEEERIVV